MNKYISEWEFSSWGVEAIKAKCMVGHQWWTKLVELNFYIREKKFNSKSQDAPDNGCDRGE